jgi:hypothetical protein
LARADAATVKLFWRGQLIKVHPRQPPGHRHTDPADLPSDIAAYALRDLDALHRRVAAHGEHIGTYTAALLDHPLPWTQMRQVYRLLGLVGRHGDQAVNTACQQTLKAKAINAGLIDRMLTRGRDHTPMPTHDPPAGVPAASRFVREPTEFTIRRPSSTPPPPPRQQRPSASRYPGNSKTRCDASSTANCSTPGPNASPWPPPHTSLTTIF